MNIKDEIYKRLPDINRVRTYHMDKYRKFLANLLSNKNVEIIPLREFSKRPTEDKILLGIRHDVDHSLESALRMAKIEAKLGIQTTYFILHTAPYYFKVQDGKIVRNESVIDILRTIQDEYGHEIGFHNDLLTLQIVYRISPREYLRKELSYLRKNGIKIVGTAAHGSKYHDHYKYINYYFFKECEKPHPNFPNTDYVRIGDKKVIFEKGTLKEFDLEYEAYFLPYDYYFSDCQTVRGGKLWHPEMLDIKKIPLNSRIQILIHPCRWYSYHELITSIKKRILHKINAER